MRLGKINDEHMCSRKNAIFVYVVVVAIAVVAAYACRVRSSAFIESTLSNQFWFVFILLYYALLLHAT